MLAITFLLSMAAPASPVHGVVTRTHRIVHVVTAVIPFVKLFMASYISGIAAVACRNDNSIRKDEVNDFPGYKPQGAEGNYSDNAPAILQTTSFWLVVSLASVIRDSIWAPLSCIDPQAPPHANLNTPQTAFRPILLLMAVNTPKKTSYLLRSDSWMTISRTTTSAIIT